MTNEDGAPDLDELRRELEAVGMVVVPFGHEIHVRRSTLEYVKVRVDDGVLRCEPYVGMLSLTRTTWALLAAEAVVIPALLLQPGTAAVGLVGAFVGILGFGFHALRYILADVTISRVQAVWLDIRARHRVAAALSPLSLPATTTRALAEGTAPAYEEPRVHQVRTPT